MPQRVYPGIFLGAVLTGLSLELCYIPHGLLDGGMTGLAAVIGRTAGLPPVWVLFAANVTGLLVGVRHLGRDFIGRAAAGLLGFVAVLYLVGPLPPWLPQRWAAMLGGAATGLGLSLVLRLGGALDASEIIALVLRHRYRVSLLWFLFWFNTVLFTLVTALYGVRVSLHSALAQGVLQGILVLFLGRPHPPGQDRVSARGARGRG